MIRIIMVSLWEYVFSLNNLYLKKIVYGIIQNHLIKYNYVMQVKMGRHDSFELIGELFKAVVITIDDVRMSELERRIDI